MVLFQEQEAPSDNGYKAEALYFAVFDGHAGTGAALMAANCLHEHIRVSLGSCLFSKRLRNFCLSGPLVPGPGYDPGTG